MIPKKNRLGNNRDIKKILFSGFQIVGKYGTLKYIYLTEKRNAPDYKIAIPVKKILGKAHRRNKLRRQIDSVVAGYFKENRVNSREGVYLGIVFIPNNSEVAYTDLKEDLEDILRKIPINESSKSFASEDRA